MGKNINKKYNTKILLLFRISSIISIIYIFWRIFFTVPTRYGIISFVFGILLVVSETVGIFEEYEHFVSISKKVVPELPEIKSEDFPDVDVFIATHNESVDLLYKTVNGCTFMDYPDKNKVHIFICDDTNRVEMKNLADRLGVGYCGIEGNKDAKAGNLNNALKHTKSPLIATFDADMIPRRDFLMATVPYFFGNEKVGFIQTPQSFYNADLFQFNLYSEYRIPNEQDFFFKEINVGRNRVNAPIYAGSNTLISRQALEEVGGIQTGTVTEDFATGVYIQSKGYKCFAVDDVHANGLAPTDVISLVKQRERWGRGCVQSFKKAKILANKGLSLGAKISYFSCLLYWWTFIRRYIYIISPIMFAVFGVKIVDCALSDILIFWLPYFMLTQYASKMISGSIRTARWSDVIDTIIFPYMIIPIIKETFGIKEKKFAVTAKDKSTFENNAKVVYALPHIFLLVFSFIGLYICLSNAIQYQTLGAAVIIFWLCINIYNLSMATFFMMGRKDLRESTRFKVEIPIELIINNKVINGATKDISETGMCVALDFAYPIENKDNIEFKMNTEFYSSKGKLKLSNVVQFKDCWEYRFIIEELSQNDKRQYFQIVYDREHSLPTKIKPGLSIYDDFYMNINKRIDGLANSKRMRPRIDINKKFMSDQTDEVVMVDFNYDFVLLKGINNDFETLTLNITKDIKMDCKYERRFTKGSSKLYLYKIINAEELIHNNEFIETVRGWLNKSAKKATKDHKNRSFNAWDEFDDMEMFQAVVEE